jgi:hypothetical protein
MTRCMMICFIGKDQIVSYVNVFHQLKLLKCWKISMKGQLEDISTILLCQENIGIRLFMAYNE